MEAIAEAWGSSYEELLSLSKYDPEGYIWETIGYVDEDPIEHDVIVITKPPARKNKRND
jgi:hypothetical protein